MIKRRMLAYLVVLAVGCWFVTGCGGGTKSSVPTVSVSGTVSMNGKPLEGVTVMFTKTTDWTGNGLTDSSGKYSLKAEAGENKVLFRKEVKSGELSDEEQQMQDMADMGAAAPEEKKKVEQVISEKYTSGAGISFTVPEGGTDTADFSLD